MQELSESNWDQTVNESNVPFFVEFWAPWCPFCRRLTPIYEKVAEEFVGKAKFAKLNVDDQPGIASRFGVLTIPLIKVFCNQRSVAERSGFTPEVQLKAFIEQAIKETPSCVAGSSMLVSAKVAPPGSEQDVLLSSKVIAVVGLSKDPNKDSYSVAEYLRSRGYEIVPVNPTATEILGKKAYPSLLEIPQQLAKRIDIVDIFRPSDQVPPVVDQSIQLREKYGNNPRAVWMQLGIENPEAAAKAERAGLSVTQNMCVAVEHRRRTFPRVGPHKAV
ncbi:MAG TPA: CoA-binding protein [Nitrososphaerales archaeon]|nr:CoA-binding protein [Nitrososphaerales archaeon]